MGKEVDFEALAVQYIWEHLKELNMGVPIIECWRSRDLAARRSRDLATRPRNTVLFTMLFTPTRENNQEEIQLPIAILTEDGILRFLIGSGTVDLKAHKPLRASYCKG